MTWTKLAYGTLVAAGLVGGTAIYYSWDRSTVKAIDIYTLAEATLERSAAVADWPFTTNTSTAAGFGTQTNVAEARSWNFNFYDTIPLFGSVNHRTALSQTLTQIKAIVPSYVDWYNGTNVIMHSVTGLWDRLNIGNQTNLWTVGFTNNIVTNSYPWTTNRYPVYGLAPWSTMTTVTLAEAWAVLNAMTCTARSVSDTWSSNRQAKIGNDDRWTLSDETDVIANTFPDVYDPNPMAANWRPPGASLLDDATVAALGTYSLSEVSEGDYGPFYAHTGYGGEVWEFNTDIYGRLVLFMERTNYLGDPNYIFRSDIGKLISYGGTNKIVVTKSTSHYDIAIPTFPSGVVANMFLVYSVTGAWSAGEITITNDIVAEWGVHTNYIISGVATHAVPQIAFMGSLSTNASTKLTFDVSPKLEDWLPGALQTYEIPHYYQTKTNWTPTAIFSWVQETAYQWPVVVVYADDSYQTPSVDGVVYRNSAAILITKWSFRYK